MAESYTDSVPLDFSSPLTSDSSWPPDSTETWSKPSELRNRRPTHSGPSIWRSFCSLRVDAGWELNPCKISFDPFLPTFVGNMLFLSVLTLRDERESKQRGSPSEGDLDTQRGVSWECFGKAHSKTPTPPCTKLSESRCTFCDTKSFTAIMYCCGGFRKAFLPILTFKT